MGLSEADTRSKLIDPKLLKAGWKESQITREYPVTDGKILDANGNRNPKRFADYVLYHGGMIIAIVEAKDEDKDPLIGIPQAKDYCKMTNTMFAYSSNGHKIEEFDFTTNEPRTVEEFPTPEELFQRLIEGRFGKLEHDPFTQTYHKGRFQPRYYQDAAIKKIFEAYFSGQKNILITMATGSGKTKVAFQTIWKLYKAGNIKRALFITDRNFLVANAVNEFEPFFNEGVADVWGTKDASINKDIHIATYQSLYSGEEGQREFQKLDPDYFDFIIIDECHRSGFGSWNAILKRFKKCNRSWNDCYSKKI